LSCADEAERYRQLVELQGDYLSLATAEGELLYVNAAYAGLYQRRPEDMIGCNLFDFVPHEQRAALQARLAQALAERKPLQSKNQVIAPGGELRWVLWTNMGFADEGGALLLHSVGRDIQAQIETEARLRESETRFRLIAEASLDVIIALDRNLRRTYVSPASREVFGFAPEELIGGQMGLSAHPDDFGRFRAELQALLDGRTERQVVGVRRRHRAGHWIWTELCFRAVRDAASGEISGLVAFVRDVTERKAAEEKLAEDRLRLETLAGQDGLTGLANRRLFDEALLKEHRRTSRGEERLCLVMIDVDRFKAYNDAYGHLAGDEALRQVAGAIRPCLRRADDLAARYGGEEFAVLSPGASLASGGLIGEKIRRAVRSLAIPHVGSEHGIVTVSVGVAATTRRDFLRDRDTLVSSADAALYEAKRAGRDRVKFAEPVAQIFRAGRE
jgi:diguanylate cyclase (GGDEF)-like protein/PAS domain S-box-containing protein